MRFLRFARNDGSDCFSIQIFLVAVEKFTRSDDNTIISIILIMWYLTSLFCKHCHFYEIFNWYSGVVVNLLKWRLVFVIVLQNHRWNTFFIDNMAFLIGKWLKIIFICLTHSILANVYVLTIKSGFIACCISPTYLVSSQK